MATVPSQVISAWTNTILPKIKFWAIGDKWGLLKDEKTNEPEYTGIPFSASDRAIITKALQDLYYYSATGRTLLNAAVTQANTEQQIRIFETVADKAALAITNTGVIGFNIAGLSTENYTTKLGQLIPFSLAHVAAHELAHAVYGTRDLGYAGIYGGVESISEDTYNKPDFDFSGATVAIEYNVMRELAANGILPPDVERAGYMGAFAATNALMRTDISYTNGNVIDVVYEGDRASRADNTQNNVMDTSKRQGMYASRDLIWGFYGDDTITSGALNDYLYGGVGNDTLAGGSGDDLLHGGDRKTDTARDGTDTATYATGDLGAKTPGGITVLINEAGAGEWLRDPDLAKPGQKTAIRGIVVSNDGYGNKDSLYSIENIIGTDQKDTVIFAGNTLSLKDYKLSAPLNVDAAGSSDDTVDARSMTIGVTIDLKNPANQYIRNNNGGTTIQLKNFEQSYGGSGNDTLYGQIAKGSYLNGGAGADTLIGGNANDTILGETGNDTIYASYGVDSVDGGKDRDTVIFSGAAINAVVGAASATSGLIATVTQGKGNTNSLYNVEEIRGTDTMDRFEVRRVINGLVLDGGWQCDTISTASLTGTMAVDLAAGTLRDLSTGATIRLKNIEFAECGNGNDSITGKSLGYNRLNGGGGNDTITGGQDYDLLLGDAGNDTLAGGGGNDFLLGGLGNDTYVIGANDGADTIYDGNGIDTIRFAGRLSSVIATRTANNDLVLNIGVSRQKITVGGQYDNPSVTSLRADNGGFDLTKINNLAVGSSQVLQLTNTLAAIDSKTLRIPVANVNSGTFAGTSVLAV